MTKVSDTYKWEEMCQLTEEDMDNLLLFYPPNKVPTLAALKALRKNAEPPSAEELVDFSFGFSVGG
jgi:precorrin-2 dehydrogenase / sirohydrochlorin ferrochelatase